MRSANPLPEGRFALVMAPGSPAPDTLHKLATIGGTVTTYAGQVITPVFDDVGRYIDLGSGAVVAQSVVDWFINTFKALQAQHPEKAPEDIERMIDAPTDGSAPSVSQLGAGVSIMRYDGKTTVIAPHVPESHATIQNKINTQARLLSAIKHLQADLETAGVRLDHWAITEIQLLARRV